MDVVSPTVSVSRLRVPFGKERHSAVLSRSLFVDIEYGSQADASLVAAAIKNSASRHALTTTLSVVTAPSLWFSFRFFLPNKEDDTESAEAVLKRCGFPDGSYAVESTVFAPITGKAHLGFAFCVTVHALKGQEQKLLALADFHPEIRVSPPPMCHCCLRVGVSSHSCREKACVKARTEGRSRCWKCGTLQPSGHHKQCTSTAFAKKCVRCPAGARGQRHNTLHCPLMRPSFAPFAAFVEKQKAQQPSPTNGDFPALSAAQNSAAAGATPFRCRAGVVRRSRRRRQRQQHPHPRHRLRSH